MNFDNTNNKLITIENQYIICPYCSIMVEVVELNCKIFRCGVYKLSGEQINQHLPKNECDRLVQTNAIYGCGKPFRIINDISPFIVEICDYI